MWCKTEFSASLLQSSVSDDPSEIILICWFAAQVTFIIIENSCAAQYILVKTMIKKKFQILWWIESLKCLYSHFKASLAVQMHCQ